MKTSSHRVVSKRVRRDTLRRFIRPRIELLEDRRVMATLDATYGDMGIAALELPGAANINGTYSVEGATFDSGGRLIMSVRSYVTRYHGETAYTDEAMNIVRLSQDGQPDTTFSGDGVTTLQGDVVEFPYRSFVEPRDVAVYQAGPHQDKVLALGRHSYFGQASLLVARYNLDGSLDPTFGNQGQFLKLFVDYEPTAIALYPEGHPNFGKFLTIGTLIPGTRLATAVITRHHADGALDYSFGVEGVQQFELEYNDGPAIINGVQQPWRHNDKTTPLSVLFDAQGKILLSGQAGLPGTYTPIYDSRDPIGVVMRLNDDGSLDETFQDSYQMPGVVFGAFDAQNPGGTLPMTFPDLALQPDGKIVAIGVVSATNYPAGYVTRLDPNSPNSPDIVVVDSSFNGVGYRVENTNRVWHNVAVAAGKVVVSNTLTNNLVGQAAELMRLNANGTPDTTFDATDTVVDGLLPGFFYATQSEMALASDGSIYVVGRRPGDTPMPDQISVAKIVDSVNRPPLASSDLDYITDEDTPLTVAAPGVLTNDVDVDGDSLSATLVSGPLHGTLTLNGNGSFHYSPFADYNGDDSFTYQASDGRGGTSDVVSARITVRPVNDPPVAINGTVSTNEDSPKIFAVSDFPFSDVEGHGLASITISAVSIAAGDTLTVGSTAVSNGMTVAATEIPTLVYTPAPLANGSARSRFDFTVNDSGAGTVQATITIDVVAKCSPGYYSQSGFAPCIAAPAGSYVPTRGATSSILAPPGTYVETVGAAAPTPSPAGFYIPVAGATSSSAAILSPAGYYAPEGSAAPILSPAGYYAPAGSAAPILSPAGYYAPEGSAAPIPSPAGYYAPEGSAAPILSPAGYYAPAGSAAPILSPAGYYAPEGSAAPIESPPGYFVPSAGAASPTPSSPGYYVPSAGSTSPIPASPGYYVPTSASTTQLACPAGTTSGVAATACVVDSGPSAGIVNRKLTIRGTEADQSAAAPSLLAGSTVAAAGDDEIKVVKRGPNVRIFFSNEVYGDFALADFDSILVDALSGDDTVLIDKDITNPTKLLGGEGDDIIKGGSGDDTIIDMAGHNVIYARPGNDTISIGDGDNQVWTDGGDDSVTAGDGSNEIHAGQGTNSIVVGHGNNQIWTHGGIDSIFAGDGDNEIHTGGQQDIVHVGHGNNTIWSQAEADAITTGDGDNTIYGGAGDDVIVVGGGDNTIHGGAGSDVIRVNGSGTNTIYGDAGDDLLVGGTGNDMLSGGAGDDMLVGHDGDDLLHGDHGRDLMIGGRDADTLIGDAGDDLLVAGWTAFDGNDQALKAILAEWTSKNKFEKRVAYLSGAAGGANAGVFLRGDGPARTVFNDSDIDTLIGNQGQDWFFADQLLDEVED